MKVVVRQKADDDIDELFQWIAQDNPRAAVDMVARIRDHINMLELGSLARMGRAGIVKGTLELIEYPYVIVYRVDDTLELVEVLAIVHGARDPKTREVDSP